MHWKRCRDVGDRRYATRWATKDAKKLVFRKDGTYAALDQDEEELWVGTFDLDPTAGETPWGIYELDGDRYKIPIASVRQGDDHQSRGASGPGVRR